MAFDWKIQSFHALLICPFILWHHVCLFVLIMVVLKSKIDIFLIGKNLKQSCNYWQAMHNQHKFGTNHIQILPHEFSLYKY
jgi:hypothetical protein